MHLELAQYCKSTIIKKEEEEELSGNRLETLYGRSTKSQEYYLTEGLTESCYRKKETPLSIDHWEQPLSTVPTQGETPGPHQQPTAASESYWGNSASEASDGNPHRDGQTEHLLSETSFRVFFPILAQATLDIFEERKMGFQHTHYQKEKPGPHQQTLPGTGLETLG